MVEKMWVDSPILVSPINEIKVVDSELEVTSFLKKKTTVQSLFKNSMRFSK